MREVVNLRLVRKARKRADKASQAASNRARSGRSKAEKQAATLDAARAARQIDGAKRERD